MKSLVIFGLGKIADVAFHHFVRDGQYQVAAFTCDSEWLSRNAPANGLHLGRPVVPFEEVEKHFPPDTASMFIAIGYHELNLVRATKCAQAKTKGYALANYVSPRADHGPWLDIGENCLVLDGVGIQPGTKIGNNVFLWNNVLVGHHSTLHDHCWVAAGATLGGMMELGARSFVGLNATIAGELTIGENSFLGAASLVLKSAPARSVFIAPGTEKFRLDSDAFLRMTRMPAIGARKN